jgi:hypothetical protein
MNIPKNLIAQMDNSLIREAIKQLPEQEQGFVFELVHKKLGSIKMLNLIKDTVPIYSILGVDGVIDSLINELGKDYVIELLCAVEETTSKAAIKRNTVIVSQQRIDDVDPCTGRPIRQQQSSSRC